MNRLILAAAFSVIAFTCCTSYATESQSDEKTLESLEQTWLRAVISGDRQFLDQSLDENYVEKMPDGRLLTKRGLLDAPVPPSSLTQQLRGIEVHVTGDTAVIWGVDHSVDSLLHKSADLRYTHVYVRRNGKWRVVASDWSQIR